MVNPKIQMRHAKHDGAVCCSCGTDMDKALEMYDIKIGPTVLTICDVCNEALLDKVLSAHVAKNGKVKSDRDMAIIRRRQNGTYTKEEVDEDGTRRHKATGYSIQHDAE